MPIRTYLNIAKYAFGATFIANMFSNGLESFLPMPKPPVKLSETPLFAASCLLTKSLGYGLLWPAIPFKIMFKPADYFILGGSFMSTTEAIKDCMSAANELAKVGQENFDPELFKKNMDTLNEKYSFGSNSTLKLNGETIWSNKN